MNEKKYPLFAIILVTLGSFYSILDPQKFAYSYRCPIHLITGYDCPGCGLQRAAHSILHGRLREAMGYNALVVLVILYGLLVLADNLCEENDYLQRLKSIMLHKNTVAVVFVVTVVYTVIRNI